MDFTGMTDAQVAKRNKALLPKRRVRVEKKCPDGHVFDERIKPESQRCRGCFYFRCELEAWGLLNAG